MYVSRKHLLSVLNALYDSGTTKISVKHPCETIGELFRFDLEDNGIATVRFTQGAVTYQENREAVEIEHGSQVFEDLPDENSYIRGVIGGGLLPLENHDDLLEFVRRRGYPDLEAGHSPIMIGLDTNLMGFRIPEVLDIDPRTGRSDASDRPATTGYALSKGVKKELDWHYKHYETRRLTEAFGEEFARLQNQPAGDNREGFLGLYEFRRLASRRTADLVPAEDTDEIGTGDEEIIEAYRQYDIGNRKRVLLFSNDYGFIDNAQEAGVWAHHVSFPIDLPRTTTASWEDVANALYVLAVQFGVLQLPKITLYGVWDGKTGKHWQDEKVEVDVRSPVIEPKLGRAIQIVERFDQR
ncbi:hypothetical protein [Natronorarus salvus]|uniref:hypothetical protein n=1 Tax=Natronorarus salvus TaxID=3117733 RepID=UPI002F269CC5